MIKKLFKNFFDKFCGRLETPIAPDNAFVSKGYCDDHPKFKHRCSKCQDSLNG
jgi:hypothetical protein